MKEFLKKNFAVLLAFILPILLIAIVALSTYLPSLFLSTNYNFVYSACTDGRNYYSYPCGSYLQQRYTVVNNKLVIDSPDATQDLDKNGVLDLNQKYADRIFLHDTKKNESREITLAEAQALTFNSLLTSPDGITVSNYYNTNGGDFFSIFGGRPSTSGYYLTKGKTRSKINLINGHDQYYYLNNFEFIGWVLPGRD